MRKSSEVASLFFLGIKGHLRSVFESSGLSYSQAAKILGVDRATVRRWLQDDDPNCIDLLGMAQLSHYLNIPIQQLLPITPWGIGQQQLHGIDDVDRALVLDLLTRIKHDYRLKQSRRKK